MLSETSVQIVPEGGETALGINLWEGDGLSTSLRLIYRSKTANWYFRIRGPLCSAGPKYIFYFKEVGV